MLFLATSLQPGDPFSLRGTNTGGVKAPDRLTPWEHEAGAAPTNAPALSLGLWETDGRQPSPSWGEDKNQARTSRELHGK